MLAPYMYTLYGTECIDYVHFPWEPEGENTDGEDIVRRMLQYIGEDPTRPGLVDTPRRIVKMWSEIYRAYKEPPPEIMVVKNGEDGIFYDEMIRDQGYFYSTCEHHGVVFHGFFDFAYVPDQWIMGASKIGRTVNYFSAKMQVAERLVNQIANRIEEVVKPKGLMLIMDARHMCKEMRGLKMHKAPFGVDVVRGIFKTDPSCKNEFLSILGRNANGR
jgi:GTP cyclohydrolase I